MSGWPKLAFVQQPSAAERAEIEEAAGRGEAVPFIDDLDAIVAELVRRGVEVVATDPAQGLPSMRGLAPEEIFAFGALATMMQWLKRFGWEHRRVPSYPLALDPWLNRRTWRGTASELLAGCAAAVRPVFVKTCMPCFADGERFAGQVWPSLAGLSELHPGLAGELFFCSETVRFVSEYRCYVMHGRILGIYPYQLLDVFCAPMDASALEQHDRTLRPTCEFVHELVRRWEQVGGDPAAYALDLGRIHGGEMSLVEVNDALAARNYGLRDCDYLDFHLARWSQLASRG